MSFKIPNKALVIQLIILLILILALPFALSILKEQTFFRARAGNDPIVFQENDNVVVRNGQKVAIKPEVVVELTSTLGPPESSSSGLAMGQVLSAEITTTPSATPCSNFYLSHTGGSGSAIAVSRTNNWGGHEYDFSQASFTADTLNFFLNTNPINGTTPFLSITESSDISTTPPTTVSMVTTNSASQKLINIPKNVGATKKSYKIAAQLDFTGSATAQSCDPITINVDPPPTTTPTSTVTPIPTVACGYQSTLIKFKNTTDTTSSWTQDNISIVKGTAVKIAAVHTSGGVISQTPATDVVLNYNNNNDSVSVNKESGNLTLDSSGVAVFTPDPGQIGNSDTATYTITATTTGGSGASCQASSNNLKVKGSTSSGPCSYQGTEIMFRDPTEPNPEWRPQSPIVYKGRSIEVSALHTTARGISETPANDVTFTFRSSNEQPRTFTAPSTGIISFTPNPGNITGNATYTVDVATIDQSGASCTNNKQFTVTPASVRTRYYKIADSPTALATASAKLYTKEPTMETVKFSDTSVGRKFVFVQFIGIASDGTEKTETRNAYIDYVGSDPIINNLTCTSQLGDGSIVVQIQGQNLGTGSDSSAVTVNSLKAEVLGDWTDKNVTAKTTGTTANQNKQDLKVNLTRSDGQQVKSKCTIGVSQVSLATNNFCQGTSSTFSQKTANITLVDSSGNISKETAMIDSDRVLKGLKATLQENQRYRFSVKLPNSLVRGVEFKAGKGTTILNSLDIPLGDLNNDGKINAADYTILLRAWRNSFASSQNASSSAQISNLIADFNNDGVVNSFDLACLLHSFNLQNDSDVEKPPTPELSITPTLPVASESATPTSIASQSATISP